MQVATGKGAGRPPSAFGIDLAALIAERGPDAPYVNMAPPRRPCGGRKVSVRIAPRA